MSVNGTNETTFPLCMLVSEINETKYTLYDRQLHNWKERGLIPWSGEETEDMLG